MARQLTAKQIRYFGTKAQKAALRRKRSGGSKPSKKAGKKKRRAKPSAWKRSVRWVKKNPVKSVLAGVAGTGGLVLAASPRAREAASKAASGTAAAIRPRIGLGK